MLVLAIWAATLSSEAPLLILLAFLTTISLNFSLPAHRSYVGLVPVVVVMSLLLLGMTTAVILFLISVILAELVRPFWQPLWDHLAVQTPSRRSRFGITLVYLLALILSNWLYELTGNSLPLLPTTTDLFLVLLQLGTIYGTVYFLLQMGWWLAQQRPLRQFWLDNAPSILSAGLLSQPFALLGAIIYQRNGLPAFIIFALGIAVFSILIWLSWQRRYILQQQLNQMAALNQIGSSLRETLELPDVIEHTRQLVTNLMTIDTFHITLHDATSDQHVDDFTHWVLNKGRTLDLDQSNMHFATRHNLTPPIPQPDAWLGLPLTSGQQLIGALVLQRFAPNPPFTHWNKEVLVAIAGQTSAAIQNARLYSETVRLYNLTDAALARRVEQLQALLNAMHEGVILLDTTGQILLANEMAAELLNQPAPALTEQQLSPEMGQRLGYSHFQITNLQPTSPTTFITNNRHIERRTTAVASTDGQLMGWLLLFRDVTEEQELAERRTDLTRMIVHDLRNPITTIHSTLNRVLTPKTESTIAEPLIHAQRTTLDMLDLVDSLMDINRMDAGQLLVDAEAMRLPPLIERTMARLQPLAEQKQITFTSDIPPDLPAIWADAELVRRVLVNLLDNALKFTPSNGRCHIKLQPEPATTNAEPGLRCLITDSGPGIPPDMRNQVFERFMRTNRGGAQVRGTGLGLTFCKLTIEAHNGRIWVEDAPDGGTQFVFTLPGIPNWDKNSDNPII